MIAIQIRVNGRLVATCGAGALRTLVAKLAARWPAEMPDPAQAQAAEPAAAYSGDPRTDEVLKWVGTRIAVGDEITLKFVESPPLRAPHNRRHGRPRSPASR